MRRDIEALLRRYPGADTFRFGDTPELVAELTALVRSGKKRATCSHMAEIEAGAKPPEVGRCDIALNFDGSPALVIRTLEVRETRFAEMTEEMALLEGEDDSLEGWREGHEEYYRRIGVFDPQMLLIWERFELVEDFGDRDV